MKLFFIITLLATKLFSEDCSAAINLGDDLVSLKGGWLFQRGDVIDWKDTNLDDSSWTRKSLPDFGKDKNVETFGFYWYRCHIFFPEGTTLPTSIAINLGKLRDADEAYFNGNKIGSTASFPPELTIDTERNRIYSIADRFILPGKNVLAIRIYSITPSFGVTDVPQLGKEWKVNETNVKSEILPILSGFIFILMGCFFGLGSIVKTPNKSNLFFSLFSIFLGFYTLCRTSYRYLIFEDFITSYEVELLVLFCLPILFINFFTQFLNIKRNKYTFAYDIFQVILILLVLFIGRNPKRWVFLIDTNIIFLLLPVGYIIYLIRENYKKHKKRLKLFFIGTLGLFPFILIDALKAIEIINIPTTLHIGFMFFLITISIQISEEMVDNYKNYQKQEGELVKMERVKTNFLFNVSSEFKSYLDRSQILIRELIVDKPKEKIVLERLNDLESLSGLMKSMIRDAIVLTQLENKKYDSFTERFSIKDLIAEILHLLKSRHKDNRNSLEVVIIGDDFEVAQNKELVFLVFYHLLENLFLYTEKKTKASLKLENINKYLIAELKDSGEGIPYAEQSDIFKKFVRGGKALEEDIPGSGIGLTLVKTICKHLGGNLKLDSSPGNGTNFYIQFKISPYS
ncbi:MAG: sensor histidine kinase [Leptospiraceae bacterium]|nr:sensor histidine kinase [Leptospiraceae bacterium]